MVHTKRVQEKVQKDITTAITNQTVFVMTEYFRPHWNFKFEKSSIRRWLKVKKKDWRTHVNFVLTEFKIFYWSIQRVEFLYHVNFMVGNFLRS